MGASQYARRINDFTATDLFLPPLRPLSQPPHPVRPKFASEPSTRTPQPDQNPQTSPTPTENIDVEGPEHPPVLASQAVEPPSRRTNLRSKDKKGGLTHPQVAQLKELYLLNPYPVSLEHRTIAQQIGAREHQVRQWFAQQRIRTKQNPHHRPADQRGFTESTRNSDSGLHVQPNPLSPSPRHNSAGSCSQLNRSAVGSATNETNVDMEPKQDHPPPPTEPHSSKSDPHTSDNPNSETCGPIPRKALTPEQRAYLHRILSENPYPSETQYANLSRALNLPLKKNQKVVLQPAS